ncbi:MAG: UvrD-helicase domain-containing protein [Sporichthyaceae bacterium]
MTSPAFDLLGPLPTGTSLLEASAGTGKTYTIAALVTRYVAEGAAELGELLVVTFGRSATRELRERVRERLTSARDGLRDPARARTGDDRLLAHLATGDLATVRLRQQRLAAATADFDAATIVTTHAFCQLVLRGLGAAASADPDTALVEDIRTVVSDVAADFYLRKYHRETSRPDFDPALAQMIAADAAQDRHAALEPRGHVRVAYAEAVRTEVHNRLTAARTMGFDDLLTRLRDALADPVCGPTLAARLQSRYRVVLVDEFQDTDPAQWDILRSAFGSQGTLVLIGDPKQAIYAFRGGDVHSYLRAAADADSVATLPHNYRSDARVLRALHTLLGGIELGDRRIVVGEVSAGNVEPLLQRPGGGAPVRLRVVSSTGLPTGKGGVPLVAGVRAAIVDDLGAQIVDVLTDDSTLREKSASPARAVRPGDIAVLVATAREGDLVRQRLTRAGVPTVLRTHQSVFATRAAGEWVTLLEAVEAPSRAPLVRRLAISDFIGFDADALVSGGEGAHDLLVGQLRRWAAVLAEHGPAGLFARVDAERGTCARLLAIAGGERVVTDLRHIADVLHAATTADGLRTGTALAWLRRRIVEAAENPGAERSRRLDSDAAAVQIVTIHSSKGLEFPLVYLPFAWTRRGFEPPTALFHDPVTAVRSRHLGGPGWDEALAAHTREQAGEDLRLLYVAATRARSALTVWWAPSTTTRSGPLHRVLFAPRGAPPPPEVAIPDDAQALARLTELAGTSQGSLAVEAISAPGAAAQWTEPARAPGVPVVAVFDRSVDLEWRRTSYSSLTAAAHEASPSAAPEPERPGTIDEGDGVSGDGVSGDGVYHDADPDDASTPLLARAATVSLFDDLPAGAAFGTLVHQVLELLDPAAPDLPSAVDAAVATALAHATVPATDPDLLGAAVLASLHAPLGPLADGRALSGFAAGDRLCELEFELPLAGGDQPGRRVHLGELAALLTAHLDPGDPVRPYAERLRCPDLAGQPLRGYLTGSIDAVLRLRSQIGAPDRYLVVDYKTNRLHPRGPAVDAWLDEYRAPRLGRHMCGADYPLQALLYLVALHRYLTWRHIDYDPATQLGGALYLFLRGMAIEGAGAPDGLPGVFAWRPPAALVVATSDLLAGLP